MYLSLNGTVYANDSIIQITKIGETNPYTPQNKGLQCVTDRMPCCGAGPNRYGEWYFPNETIVPIEGRAVSFYRNRGDDGAVNLNRVDPGVIFPTGLFCCVIPDAIGVFQRVCTTISKFVATYSGLW